MQTPTRLSFEDYLSLEVGTVDGLPKGRHTVVDGALVAVPPESEPNSAIATKLLLLLVQAGMSYRLIKTHTCEVEVPPLSKPKVPRTRYPDLVVLRPEHLELTQRRLTITREMPAPQLVVEVVSPGRSNRQRDYEDKLVQYAERGVPEYWILDRGEQRVSVLTLVGEGYEVEQFFGEQRVVTGILPGLVMTAEQVLEA
ncbi:MAG: Uma2 family endonuclease [Elainellaceae cyanobacterium]